MKLFTFILLLILPIVGFSQDLGGTGWKIQDADGDTKIILFEKDGTFTYLNVTSKSGNQGAVFSDPEETWKVNGNKVTISFSNGYNVYSGTFSSDRTTIKGTSKNKQGLFETFTATLIEFNSTPKPAKPAQPAPPKKID